MADPQAETLCKSVYTDCATEAIHACQKPLGHEGLHEDDEWMWHDYPPMGSPSVFDVTAKDALIRLTRKISEVEARNEALLQALKAVEADIKRAATNNVIWPNTQRLISEALLDSGSASQEAKTGGLIPSPELQALLEKTRHRAMTSEEQEAQRRSWARGEAALGTDADEARERAAIREIKDAAKGKEKS